jgi:hypothetical protein
VGPSILAFRPAVVVDRLPARNGACPISLRDLLRVADEARRVLPLVQAPIAGVMRGALVAAKEADSALGLALPPGTPPEPWFDAVAAVADELAPGLPIFLGAEVTVAGAGAAELGRAEREAYRLVDAGITHLAIDVRALPGVERARGFAAVAAPATERGACVDCLVTLEDAPRGLVAELDRAGKAPDVISVRCPGVTSQVEARAQVVRLVKLCAETSGIPVLRRGPVTPLLLGELARSPVRACEDGGGAASAAISAIPREVLEGGAAGASRRPALEQAARALDAGAADLLEARAYVEAAAVIEGLGSAGSASSIAASLARLLEER